MLSLLTAWVALALLSTAVGFDVLRRCRALALGRPGDRAVLATWLGLSVLAAVLLAAAVVAPLSPLVSLVALGGTAALALASPGTRRAWRDCWSSVVRRSRLVGLGVLAVAVALFAAQPVTWYDTGLYHYGVVHWLQRHGEVPGLALIHLRFGQVSSWFALGAPLDTGAWRGRMTAATGGFAVLVALAHSLLGGARALAGSGGTEDWFAFFLLPTPGLLIWIASAPSPSPDVPVLLITGVVAWAFLLISAQVTDRKPGLVLDARLVPFVLAGGAVAMKLSAVPLLAVSAFYFWRRAVPSLALAGASTAVAALFLVPLVSAGIVTSGCPIYPSPIGCLDVPWGVGAAQAADYSVVIKRWAQWDGPTPLGRSEGSWLLPWLRANRSVAALLVASALAVALLIIGSSRVRAGRWVAAAGAVGVVFVLLTAPADRFVFAYALVPPALLAAHVAVRLWPARGVVAVRGAAPGSVPFTVLASAAAVLLAADSLRAPRQAPLASESGDTPAASPPALIVPPRLASAAAPTPVVAGGFVYYTPQRVWATDQCWATAQPCTPYLTHEGVSLRDARRGLRGGFKRPSVLAHPKGVRLAP